MAPTKAAFGAATGGLAACAAIALACVAVVTTAANAQNFPITPQQRNTAEVVAQSGIPLSELSPKAPDSYTVKRGDTLWAISGLYLLRPWRWPELWGMNMQEIHNPHRIYPGQVLYLEKVGGMARLRAGPIPPQAPLETVRVSPRVRFNSQADLGIPTLSPQAIEPFLNEAIIVNDGEMDLAPRFVAGPEERVLLTRGDRAYAMGRAGTPLVESDPRVIDQFRVFREAKPLRDPVTNAILGYEAAYLGAAELVRSESVQPIRTASGGVVNTPVPATVDITRAREEIRIGDRLVPEPPRQIMSYVPRAPSTPVDGTIVSVYGDAVALAGQNQVVAINRGTAEGMEPGVVLAIQKAGAAIKDRSQRGEIVHVQLPDERNGLMMVFRTFDHLSYALILHITDVVQVGDRFTSPK
ncbi:LysM peptidoglycan-binding domain-containing protein [Ramlibacter sp. G-1-2-2]|uniref:LysM peptidoglycan-binding domain-containing protein n=1 Tax=Ramlibacter agri TaxID=2728837 RepID=A0A848H1Z9_9BURK|nr:LysM domain-containing protein [Ramlibacter agri]NML42753.1 LysM peptidoglycan-binding domain-containing protein [Ramlibacter agri]